MGLEKRKQKRSATIYIYIEALLDLIWKYQNSIQFHGTMYSQKNADTP